MGISWSLKDMTPAHLRASKKTRAPCCTPKEMAEASGVPLHTLCAWLRRDPEAPKPVLRHGSNVARAAAVYFKTNELAAWLVKAKARHATTP